MISNSFTNKDDITSPNDIGGLQFHLDANIGVYGLTDNLITSTNGAQVRRWDDNAKNQFQTNGLPLCALAIRSSAATISLHQGEDPTNTGYILNSYPTVATNAINGRNAIYFDGYSGLSIMNNVSSVNIMNTLTRGRAFFIVYKALPNAWSTRTLGLIYQTGGWYVNMFPANYPPTSNYYYVGNYFGPYTIYNISNTNGNWIFNTPSITTGNVWRILICNHERYGGTTAYRTIFNNGVMVQAGYDGLKPDDGEVNDNNISVAGSHSVWIGCRGDVTDMGDGWGGFYGYIAECGMYMKPRGLTRMEVNALTKYLKNKYAIA